MLGDCELGVMVHQSVEGLVFVCEGGTIAFHSISVYLCLYLSISVYLCQSLSISVYLSPSILLSILGYPDILLDASIPCYIILYLSVCTCLYFVEPHIRRYT